MTPEPTRKDSWIGAALIGGIVSSLVGVGWNAALRTPTPVPQERWVAKEPEALFVLGTALSIIAVIASIKSARWERVEPSPVSWKEAIERSSISTAGSMIAVMCGMLVDRQPLRVPTLAAYSFVGIVVGTLLLRFIPPKWRISSEPL
jgi:uncharacterized membrane protein YfcA